MWATDYGVMKESDTTKHTHTHTHPPDFPAGKPRRGNSLQYPCLGNRMARGAMWAIVYGVMKETDTTKHTHTHTHTHTPDFPAGKPRLKPFYTSQQSSGRGTETRREATGPQKQVLGGARGRRQVEGPGGGTWESKRTGHWLCVPSSS